MHDDSRAHVATEVAMSVYRLTCRGIDGSISDVVSTLCFLLTLEHLRPKLLKELPTSAKLVRLMCVFLIGTQFNYDNMV